MAIVLDGSNPIGFSYGGTGINTSTAYSVLCGGTSSTGPIQSVSSSGLSGQVLTSNGASDLPNWKTFNSEKQNLIINGNMEISQRGTTFLAAASGDYGIDRFLIGRAGAAVATISQDTSSVPSSNNFRTSLKIEITTADTSIATTDFFHVGQKIEGYNVRNLIGNDFTLSFWVRSPKTGTHCVALRNSGATPNRSFIAEYTINAINSWEYKTITITGGLITDGTWDWTNGVGLWVTWALSSGSTYQSTANSWLTGNFFATSNQVNCTDAISNIFQITGVQLELGSLATNFKHRFYGNELLLAQRYFVLLVSGINKVVTSGQAFNTNFGGGTVRYPVLMRTTPQISVSSANHFDFTQTGGGRAAFSSTNMSFISEYTFHCEFGGAGSLVGGECTTIISNNASSTITASAEL